LVLALGLQGLEALGWDHVLILLLAPLHLRYRL
jgi:hypothetical protein